MNKKQFLAILNGNESYGRYMINDMVTKDERDYLDWETIYTIKLASYGDYSGGTVERANFNELMASYGKLKWIMAKTYGYGYVAFAIIENYLPVTSKYFEEIIEILVALQDCPLINDESLSYLKMEIVNESWQDSYGLLGDFKDQLCKAIVKFDPFAIVDILPDYEYSDDLKEILDSLESDDLQSLCDQLMDQANEYYVYDSANTVYLDLDRVVNKKTITTVNMVKFCKPLHDQVVEMVTAEIVRLDQDFTHSLQGMIVDMSKAQNDLRHYWTT